MKTTTTAAVETVRGIFVGTTVQVTKSWNGLANGRIGVVVEIDRGAAMIRRADGRMSPHDLSALALVEVA